MRKIPKKNYFILFIFISLSVALVFYARSWYITTKEYYMQNSVIKEVASEINYNEFESYSIENPKFILYVSSEQDSSIKNFELNLKKLITNLDIQDSVVYVNMDNFNIQLFNNDLRKKYSLNSKVSNQISDESDSVIYFFDNGKISFIINNPSEYTTKYVEKILVDWKMKND